MSSPPTDDRGAATPTARELPAGEGAAAAPDPGDPSLAIFDRDDGPPLDADLLERVFYTLTALHPSAPVGAHSAGGVMMQMPATLTVESEQIQEARSGLDLVAIDERVMRGWEQLLRTGASRYPVTLVAHPDVSGTVYGVDLRERHGVIVTVAVLDIPDDLEDAASLAEAPELAPRFARMCKNEHGLITKVDEAAQKMLGFEEHELVGHRSLEFIHPDDHALAVDNWMQMLAAPGPARRIRLRHMRRDGSWMWLELTNHNLIDDAEYGCMVAEIVDISEEMSTHELIDRLARAVPVGLLQVDRERGVDYSNDRLHEILGVAAADGIDALIAGIAASDREAFESALASAIDSGREADIEVEVRLAATGELRRCSIGLRPLTQEGGEVTGAIACVADVTEASRMRDELHRRATFDALTGCYNRAATMRLLEAHLADGGESGERAVMFVDVDGFKAVNDQHGHAAGDELLGLVAERLRAAVRADDLVGRMGGDEFLIVCPDVGGGEQADALSQTLLRDGPVRVAGSAIAVELSVGVAWSQGAQPDAESLVARADHEMYAAKRAKYERRGDVSQKVPRGRDLVAEVRQLGVSLERRSDDALRRTIERTKRSKLPPDVRACFEEFNLRSTVALARWLAGEDHAVAREAGQDTWQFYGEMSARHEVQLNDVVRRCLAWRDAVGETMREIADDEEIAAPAIEHALQTLQQSLEYSLVRIAKAIDAERERTDDELAFIATHDRLTGLPNRSLLLERTSQLLGRARRRGGAPVATLIVGLDNMKGLRETLGRDRADELVRAVAERLDGCVRGSDALGRTGEDEFLVMLDGDEALEDGPCLVAERIRETLREPFALADDSGRVAVSCCIGVAVSPSASAEALIRDAEIAMRHAMWEGRHGLAVFEPGMEQAADERGQLEVELRDALAGGQLELFYQPIASLGDLTVTGMEALLRWRHPERGLVLPSAFIPLLEENDQLIVEVGGWVLGEACRFAARCAATGHRVQMSVNVSARQLDSELLVAQVRDALASSRLDGPSLTIELTETTLMRDVDLAVRTLRALRELGVRVAIDDFGTGYSSLSHLRLFPIDELKIDRSFVSRLEADSADATLVATMLQLGRALSIQTVAEGIETPEQLSLLRDAGCDRAQGYLIARPLEEHSAAAFLRAPVPGALRPAA